MLVIAHRGARYRAPENTLAAFEAAIADGVEAVEFDVLVTKDSTPVVCHDDNLRRLAGLDLRISGMTAADLADVEILNPFKDREPMAAVDTAWAIPTLEQVLESFHDRGALYVELKAVLEPEVEFRSSSLAAEASAELLRPCVEKIVISSFDWSGLEYMRRTLGVSARLALTVGKPMAGLPFFESAAAMNAEQLHIDKALATKDLLAQAHAAGLRVMAFTVNDADEALELRELGADGIFSDEAKSMMQALSSS